MVNKYSNLENFFKSYITVDLDMFGRIRAFRQKWATKRIDSHTTNLDFLSGITMGVQPVRFSSLDEEMLANEVLRVDVKAIQTDLYRVEGIYRERRVHSNAIYQLLTYVLREGMVNKVDESYLMDTYLVMSYKMLTSMIVRRFEYSLDPRVANAVVEKMSRKFILKELGSWEKYLEYRGSFVMPGSKNGELLIKSYSAESTGIVIPSLQTNIKSTVNILMGLTMDVSGSDVMVDVSSLLTIENEEIVLSDIKNSMRVYSRRALESITSRGFSDDDYIYLISEISPNINISVFKSLLIAISEESVTDFKKINDIVEDTMTTMISYLTRTDNIALVRTSVLDALKMLKSYYGSSNVKDELVVSLKKRTMDLVLMSTTVKTSWKLTALNINFILYLVLVAIVKK